MASIVLALLVLVWSAFGMSGGNKVSTSWFDEKIGISLGRDVYLVLEPNETVYFLCAHPPGVIEGWTAESFGVEAGAIYCADTTESVKRDVHAALERMESGGVLWDELLEDEYVVLYPGDTLYFLCARPPGTQVGWKVVNLGLESGKALSVVTP